MRPAPPHQHREWVICLRCKRRRGSLFRPYSFADQYRTCIYTQPERPSWLFSLDSFAILPHSWIWFLLRTNRLLIKASETGEAIWTFFPHQQHSSVSRGPLFFPSRFPKLNTHAVIGRLDEDDLLWLNALGTQPPPSRQPSLSGGLAGCCGILQNVRRWNTLK